MSAGICRPMPVGEMSKCRKGEGRVSLAIRLKHGVHLRLEERSCVETRFRLSGAQIHTGGMGDVQESFAG